MINKTDRCYLCNERIIWGSKVAIKIIIENFETGDKGTVNYTELGNIISNMWNKEVLKNIKMSAVKSHQRCYDEHEIIYPETF